VADAVGHRVFEPAEVAADVPDGVPADLHADVPAHVHDAPGHTACVEEDPFRLELRLSARLALRELVTLAHRGDPAALAWRSRAMGQAVVRDLVSEIAPSAPSGEER
jgi:hypothetical protein